MTITFFAVFLAPVNACCCDYAEGFPKKIETLFNERILLKAVYFCQLCCRKFSDERHHVIDPRLFMLKRYILASVFDRPSVTNRLHLNFVDYA